MVQTKTFVCKDCTYYNKTTSECHCNPPIITITKTDTGDYTESRRPYVHKTEIACRFLRLEERDNGRN